MQSEESLANSSGAVASEIKVSDTGSEAAAPAVKAETEVDAQGQAENKADTGANEDYELETPEGVPMDGQALSEFKEVAKSLNMPKEAAQKVLSIGVSMLERWNQHLMQQVDEHKAEMLKAAKQDREIGPEFEKNLAAAKAAVQKFGSAELANLLSETGLENHAEVIRFLVRVGKLTQNDKPPVSGIRTVKDMTRVLYPSLVKEG